MIGKIISWVSPAWAANRLADKIRLEQLRKYKGAQVKKQDRYWTTKTTDADSEILPDLPKLRARSRDLIQNNQWAAAIIDNIVFSVVGHKGIIPQVTGGTPKQNRKLEKKIKSYLEESKNIDITGLQDFYELQGLFLRQFLICGENFCKFCFDKKYMPKKIQLQFIEPDQIWSNCTEYKGNEVRAGIEIDNKTGRHVSYFVNQHPGEYGFNWKQEETRVLSVDMCHAFDRRRPGQTRGVPLLAPIMEQLHDLGEYVTTEMVAARAAACLAVLIKRDHHSNVSADDDGDRIQNLHPGMIARLRKGEDISVVEPKRPGNHFPAFTAFQLRGVASGANVAYETLSRDYSQVNYSSARMAKLAERAYYRHLQQFIVKHFCRPVANEYINLLTLRGDIPRDVYKVTWLAPGFEWVDPWKEIKAQTEAIANNIKTKASVIAELGGDYEEVIEQRKKEIEMEKGLDDDDNENGTKAAANKGASTA